MTIPNPAARALRYARTYGIGPGMHKAARFAIRSVEMPGLPMTVHLEVSNVCNLHCEYCVLDKGARGDRVMRDETFRRVRPYLRNALRINVSGLAEPLMNTRFTSILADIRAAAPTAAIQMCTNASLLTEGVAHSLVDSRLDEVAFSLDATDAELFDTVRAGASLKGLVENISALRRVIEERGATKPALTATTVLQRKNVHQFPGVVGLAGEMGVTTVNANGLEPYVAEVADSPLWRDPDTVENLAETLREAEEVAGQYGIELRMTAMRPQPPVCPQIFRPIILADGAVVPCSVLAYPRDSYLAVSDSLDVAARRGRTPRVTFGNVNERTFAAIWRSPGYKRFRQHVSSNEFPSSCTTCLMKHYVICPQPPMSMPECLATLEG